MIKLAQHAIRSWQPNRALKPKDTIVPLVLEALSLSAANCPIEAHHHDMFFYFDMFMTVIAGEIFPDFVMHLPGVRKGRRFVNAYLDDVIAMHRKHRPDADRAPDYIDALVAAADEQGQLYSQHALRALAMLPLKNGGLNLYRSLTFMIYELLKHPDLQAEITAEVDAGFAEGIPDIHTIKCMGLLRRFVKETLRFHPIAVMLPRYVAKPFAFAGYRFVPGQRIFFAAPVTHFLPEFYSNPETFDTERYAAGRNEHLRSFVYAPFGLGPHSCLARNYSEMIAMTLLAALLRTARLQLDPPDYVLKMLLFPNPVPEAKFKFRILEHRTAPKGVSKALSVPGDSLSGLLAELRPDQQAAVMKSLKSETFPAGATIVRQGDIADKFYIIQKGEVEVLLEYPDRMPRVLNRLEKGAFFGEIGLLQGIPRTATVRALEHNDVEVVSIDQETFNLIIVETDFTSREIAQLMQKRLLLNQVAEALPDLSLAKIKQVSGHFESITYPPNAVIIRQGEPAQTFYILTEGRVNVINHHSSGSEIKVATLEAINFFGEIGLLENRPRTATVRVTPDAKAVVLALDRAGFESLMKDSKTTREMMNTMISERLLELKSQVAE